MSVCDILLMFSLQKKFENRAHFTNFDLDFLFIIYLVSRAGRQGAWNLHKSNNISYIYRRLKIIGGLKFFRTVFLRRNVKETVFLAFRKFLRLYNFLFSNLAFYFNFLFDYLYQETSSLSDSLIWLRWRWFSIGCFAYRSSKFKFFTTVFCQILFFSTGNRSKKNFNLLLLVEEWINLFQL